MTIRSDIPTCPERPAARSTGTSRDYEISLITPLFGGGVKTRENDPSFAIRPTAIRGQLQFWWRATVGAQYATTIELREEQSKVWGDTKQSSRVQICVELVEKLSEPKVCAVIKPNHKGRDQVFWEPPFHNTSLPYALYPFQGKPANNEGPKVEPASCIHMAKFRLTIVCHIDVDFAKQVEPAIWAWVNFGGLGSRTRRGCGAIYCRELAPQRLDSVDKWYRDHVPEVSYGIRVWPTMPTSFLSYSQCGKPCDQWDRVIGLLRDFRQKPGNDPGYARPLGPDRSWYPEADTIRRITGRHSQGHDPSRHLSGGNPLPDGFPRAEFGLPIVFKFIDDKSNEPKRSTLQPYVDGQQIDKGTANLPEFHTIGSELKERMASPVILKPLAFTKDIAVAIILPLQTRPLDNVALISDNGVDLIPQHALPVRHTAFVAYPDSPIRGLTKTGSALEAFLNLALQKAGTNVAHPSTGYRRVPV